MQTLAEIKKAQQDGRPEITNEFCGRIDVNNFSVDDIAASVYVHFTKAFTYHDWLPEDYDKLLSWIEKCRKFNGGQFYPLNRNIVQPEKPFDFTFDAKWAEYHYELPDGRVLDGHLAMRGTIDLITKVDDNTYELTDYKTGQRKNWRTGKIKEYEDLEKDIQLRTYHYALHKLYPAVKNFLITIYFVSNGGPFTFCFGDKDLAKTEEMIKDKFKEVKSEQNPALNKTPFCTRFCHLGCNTFEGSHVKPLVEFRSGQFASKGEPMKMCSQIQLETKRKGLDWVTEHYKVPGHDVTYYKAPGSTE